MILLRKLFLSEFLVEGLGLLSWLLDFLLSLYVCGQLNVPKYVTVLKDVETRRDLDDLVLSDICHLAHFLRARWSLLI